MRLWRELDVLHREIAALLRATASALRRGDDEKRDPPGIRPWHAAARLDKIAKKLAGAASIQQRSKRKGMTTVHMRKFGGGNNDDKANDKAKKKARK